MKSLMLATVATIALGMPAVAADQGHSGMTDPARTQSQQQSHQQMGQQESQRISPSELDQSQIRQIQQALNKHGFDAGNVDGVWGPETREAVQNFQEKRNLSTNEALNQETLSALGVDFASNMGSGGASTTGSGVRETTGSGLEASDMDGKPETRPSNQNQ